MNTELEMWITLAVFGWAVALLQWLLRRCYRKLAKEMHQQLREAWREAAEFELERDEARAEAARMQFQRDVLGLNWGQKDTRVSIGLDDAGNVSTVVWPREQSGSDTPVKLPEGTD